MTRLSVGLIGLGRLGRVYARDLSTRIPQVRLVAVADTNGDLARQIGAEFDALATDDPSALISNPNVDAVVIVSPTHTHRPLAVESLRAEKIRLADEASRRFSRALSDAAEVLTPEQRKGLAQRLERHRHRWG